MGKINFSLNRIIVIVVICTLFAVLLSSIPALFYIINFRNLQISKITSDWAQFGDFISGTSGVLLSFFSFVFALTSIYFTAKISEYIQQRDFDFNSQQKKLDIDLIHAQNKPYPYFDITVFPDKISIVLQNMGLGTLIVSSILIQYNDIDDFKTFKDLFDEKLFVDSGKGFDIIINTAENHVLAPNAEKSLLEIRRNSQEDGGCSEIHTNIRGVLRKCCIIIHYEDIFENEYVQKQNLKYLEKYSG